MRVVTWNVRGLGSKRKEIGDQKYGCRSRYYNPTRNKNG